MHSTRRSFALGTLYGIGALAAVPGVVATLSACSSSADALGPVAVRWDRDPCTNCGMVISDRRYAAQVQSGPGRTPSKFDDLGCAIGWLEQQPWGRDAALRMWVIEPADPSSALWTEATRARFVRRHGSPMGYDFAPATAGDEQGVTFAAMRAAVLQDTRQRGQRPAGSGGQRS